MHPVYERVGDVRPRPGASPRTRWWCTRRSPARGRAGLAEQPTITTSIRPPRAGSCISEDPTCVGQIRQALVPTRSNCSCAAKLNLRKGAALPTPTRSPRRWPPGCEAVRDTPGVRARGRGTLGHSAHRDQGGSPRLMARRPAGRRVWGRRAELSIEELLRRYQAGGGRLAAANAEGAAVAPSLHTAVVTCMDSRIDVFALFGLRHGRGARAAQRRRRGDRRRGPLAHHQPAQAGHPRGAAGPAHRVRARPPSPTTSSPRSWPRRSDAAPVARPSQ